MADSLTLLRKNMHELPRLQRDDQMAIREACKRKMSEVKGERSKATLSEAIKTLDELLAA